jgi:predicted permease
MNAFVRDLRHAVRLLWKSPTFTLTAVLSLGLAIGANTTLFGILDSLLWKPLPVEQPGRLVRVFARTGRSNVGLYYQGFSYPEYVDYRDGTRVVAGLAATSGVQLGFRAEGGDAIRVFGEAVSDNYFEMLGVRAMLGRVLASGPGGALNTAPEVVLSHQFWERRLAGLVLVVACANLANLLLSRAGARRKEIAMRLALGARRGQLVQQLVTEAVVLSLVAGGVGLLTAYAASRAVSAVRLPTDLPFVLHVTIDPRVLWFTLAVSLFAGVAFGLLPALRASRPDLVPALKGSDVVTSGRRRRLTLTNALVVSQVAFSLVLLFGAGLFWRSIAGARMVDPGMRLERRAMVSFSPSLLRYDPARRAAFYRTLVERVSKSPEIEHVGLTGWVPLGFQADEGTFIIRGAEERTGNDHTRSWVNVVTPDFLDTVGVSLRQGRPFTEQDTNATLPVVMVNETLARRAWPGQNPIGRQLRSDHAEAPWLTVVGVVSDGKYRMLTEAPQPYVLYPLAQLPADDLTLVAQATHDNASALTAIRREVRALDPDMPLLDVKTMEQQMAKVMFLPQAMTALAGPAAGLAMVIAAIGLYGVIAFSVSLRTREFGVRLAIGAQSRDVVRHVMSQGLAVVGVGLGLGSVAALALGRVMKGVLVGVGSTDPAACAGALGILIGVAALATYVPARRAGRVDPLAALRQE